MGRGFKRYETSNQGGVGIKLPQWLAQNVQIMAASVIAADLWEGIIVSVVEQEQVTNDDRHRFDIIVAAVY